MKRLATKLMLTACGSFVFSLTMAGVSVAESPSIKTISDTEFSGPADSLQMVGKVIFFLILIIVLFLVLIKFLSKKNQTLFKRSIRSLGGVPLGQHKSIQIVEIGHSLFVVGVGDNIQLLEKIDDPEEVAYVTDLLSSSQSEQMNFMSLGKWMAKLKGNKKEIEEEEVELASFQQVFHDKLQRVTSRNKNVEEWLSDQKQTDRLNDK
ncbi:flagellar biosynthetic protein FliO [Paenibacillus eucommiae]|uniref:Flagellar protein FliO/FliZ n=1 Tax=Paenibacillus eucommiae TaxID=1355755 RepID=A0ABS4IUQ5_9BACL|nr:flagellar biosynthetic protein FliO [Paenibacillus eucommiae]MBP1991326.1 flagellar protein FliO/FliZ [Paenibacillus eucommiae]